MLKNFPFFFVGLVVLSGCTGEAGGDESGLTAGEGTPKTGIPNRGAQDGDLRVTADQPVEGTSGDPGTRYTSIGVTVECGASGPLRTLCTNLGGLGQLAPEAGALVTQMCSGEVEAFVACDGVPGEEGSHCEACAGTSWDKRWKLGGQNIGTDSAGLYCYDFARQEGHFMVLAGAGGNVTVGGLGVQAGCGGYTGTDGEAGSYCSAGVDVDFSAWGVPVKCNLGLIALDPEQLATDLVSIITYDSVASEGPIPGAISVGCFEEEGPANRSGLEGRCTDAVGRMDSGGKSDLGFAVACESVWANDCSYFSDCPETARTTCDGEFEACVDLSLTSCGS